MDSAAASHLKVCVPLPGVENGPLSVSNVVLCALILDEGLNLRSPISRHFRVVMSHLQLVCAGLVIAVMLLAVKQHLLSSQIALSGFLLNH